MEQIEIGLWVTAGLLVLVVAGMRVAFAAALAGVVGLVHRISRVSDGVKMHECTTLWST